jgi:hypothetical protein
LPPPVAVMVMVRVPKAAFLPAVTFIVDVPVPGAAMELGLKLTVRPPPPDMVSDREIAELKLPDAVVVMVEETEVFLLTDRDVGEAERVKLAGAEERTVSDTVVVCVRPPPVPVMAMA